MASMTLPLDAVQRGAMAAVERVLAGVPGVTRVYLSREAEMAYVEYDGERCDAMRVASALHSAGLCETPAMPAQPPGATEPPPAPGRRWTHAFLAAVRGMRGAGAWRRHGRR